MSAGVCTPILVQVGCHLLNLRTKYLNFHKFLLHICWEDSGIPALVLNNWLGTSTHIKDRDDNLVPEKSGLTFSNSPSLNSYITILKDLFEFRVLKPENLKKVL